MKLFLKRDVSAKYSGFTVYDEFGNAKYFAKPKPTKLNATSKASKFNIILTNTENEQIAKIRQLPIVGTNTFVLKVKKSHITFVTVVTSKGIYSYFYGNNWHIHGDVAAKNFDIIDVDNSIISSQKRNLKSIEININDESNELYCVLTSICVCFINTIEKPLVQTV